MIQKSAPSTYPFSDNTEYSIDNNNSLRSIPSSLPSNTETNILPVLFPPSGTVNDEEIASKLNLCSWRANASLVCTPYHATGSILPYQQLDVAKKTELVRGLFAAYKDDYASMGISSLNGLNSFLIESFSQGNTLFVKLNSNGRVAGCIGVDTSNYVPFFSHQYLADGTDLASFKELQDQAIEFAKRYEFPKARLWSSRHDYKKNLQLGWKLVMEAQTHHGWKIVMEKELIQNKYCAY